MVACFFFRLEFILSTTSFAFADGIPKQQPVPADYNNCPAGVPDFNIPGWAWAYNGK